MKKILFSVIIFIIAASVCAAPITASAFTVSPSYAEKISADIYEIICLTENNTVLAAKNSGRKVSIGSLASLMTALVAADYYSDFSQEIEVPEEAVTCLANSGALGCDLSVGEILPVRSIVSRLIITTYADSATTLAFNIAGSLDSFVEMMNQKAAELKMNNTHFSNCTGFTDENSYSTAEDLAKLAVEFYKNPELKELGSKRSYTIPATNKHSERSISTPNQMLMANSAYYYTYCTGLKYASNDISGRNIIASAKYEEKEYLCIVLGCPLKDENENVLHEELKSARQLFRWAFLTLEYKNVVDINVPISEIPVKLSLDDYVSLVPEADLYVLAPKGSQITYEVYLDSEYAEAPIKKGDILGYADVICAGERIGQIKLAAQKDIHSNTPLVIWNRFLKIVTSRIFLIILSSAAALAIIIIWLSVKINKRHKARQKRNKYRKF